MAHVIAVAGKGGVGKTTLCGMLIQYLCDLRQTAWRCFDLKIAGYRSADLLGIDNGRVFLNDALLLQSLNPGLYRNS